MKDNIGDEILEAYGYIGQSAQNYKSHVYAIKAMSKSIEDHQTKQVSLPLQKLLQEERSRIMVQEQGIDLAETTRFYIEKIKEYNNIIELKHLRSSTVPRKEGLKRYTGDQGKITNYHFVLNRHNLNPVFQEIQEQHSDMLRRNSVAVSKKQTQQLKQSIIKKKNGLVTRLEQQMKTIDAKNNPGEITQIVQPIRKISYYQESTRIHNNIRSKSNSHQKYNNNNNTISTNVSSHLSRSIDVNTHENRNKDLISKLINQSFTTNTYRQEPDDSDKQPNRMCIPQIVQQCPDKSPDYPQYQYQQQKQDTILDSIVEKYAQQEINERKIKMQNRQNIIESMEMKKQPKYVHLGGSKFIVKNGPQLLRKYETNRRQCYDLLMQKELNKLKSPCESSVDLAMLEGPPRRVAYVSSNLRQDYDDVKVTKIMQNVVNLYNQ